MSDVVRRGVYLLLGGVIALPYVALATMFTMMFAMPETPLGAIVPSLAVSMVIAATPAFLRGTRAMQITAARQLLDVDLPDQSPGPLDRESRLRSALWFALHLLTGGVVAFGLLITLPMALLFVVQQFGFGREALAGIQIGPFDEHDTGWLSLIGVLLLVGVIFAIKALGALARLMAPVLLGPSTAERIAALEAQTRQLAERNRLARELHDSIGHALTVTTLQAAAARQLLGSDDVFVAKALTAIEETGRNAMADLDHVLGVLREQAATRDPHRTLADLPQLLTGDIDAEISGDLPAVPSAVSREAYRIIQEGLTNAARHGAPGNVELRIAAGEKLEIRLSNPAGHSGRAPGRGLTGMRERVSLFGGRFSAGARDGRWVVEVTLPARSSPGGRPSPPSRQGRTPSRPS